MMLHEDRTEKLVRRIESFSDLVIGFSLALLALTLKIPAHISDLVTNPWWLIAYVWTFAVICNVWFVHQRLFSHFFYPQAWTIAANFALLASIGLVVFFVQVFVRFSERPIEALWAFLSYFAITGLAFLLMGSLYLHGALHRWVSLDSQLRSMAVRYISRGLIGGLALWAGVVVVALGHPQQLRDAYALAWIGGGGMLASRIIARFVRRRVVTAANA